MPSSPSSKTHIYEHEGTDKLTLRSSVNLSRIEILNCNADAINGSASSVITVRGCHSIRLHDVVFRNNIHSAGAAALEMDGCDDSKNQTLNMTNVEFIENGHFKINDEAMQSPIAILAKTTYMTDVRVENNTGNDAIFFASNADIYIRNLVARGNTVSVLTTKKCTVTIDESTFEDNGGPNHTNGGALKFDSSSVGISNATFRRNKGQRGGVLYANGGANITIRNSHVEKNRASDGGGFWFANAGHVHVSHTVFVENNAFNDGGAVLSDNTTLNIINCTFKENNATNHGGGMKVDGGSSKIMGTEAVKNFAKSGAAIRADSGDLTCEDVTFKGRK